MRFHAQVLRLRFASALAALLALILPLTAAGAPVPPDCQDITQRPAITQEGFYVFIFPSGATEIWQESNGLDSLQRVRTWCPGGSIPNDTCITHHETFTQAACLYNYLA